VESFTIKSASDAASLEFFDREPADTNLPIEEFWVRITDVNLSIAAVVDGGYDHQHPGSFFMEMAQLWKGWPGELSWESLYGELALQATQDHSGHISLRIKMCRGHYEYDWSFVYTLAMEAGQLESIARLSALFFGR
jgi:Family of unknown function (DUF6228)